MGKLLSRNAKGQWRLWTTISDGWLTDWISEKDMKAQLVWDYDLDYRIKTIQLLWTFPHGYYDKKTHKILSNHDALIAFNEWHLQALKSDNYEDQLNAKYEELVKNNA